MSYEAHIAGVGDRPPGRPLMGAAIRAMQRASARELAARRAAVVAAVREVAPLRFVNGGGTGSVERTAAEAAVTEVAAGLGPLRPGAVRRLPRLPPRAGGAVRAAGRAQARRPHRDAAGRRLPGVGRGGRATGCPSRPKGCGSTAGRAPARSRPRCAARAPPRCAWATGCGCGTRRRASCASASTSCTWSAATRWSRRCRPTAARARRSCKPQPGVSTRGRGSPPSLALDEPGQRPPVQAGCQRSRVRTSSERRGEPHQREHDGDQQQLVEPARERRLVGRAQALARGRRRELRGGGDVAVGDPVGDRAARRAEPVGALLDLVGDPCSAAPRRAPRSRPRARAGARCC